MSLIVSIISKDKTVNCEIFKKEIQYPCNDFFGFENWRQKLWGHKIIKDFECDLIYSLKETDVHVYDLDVTKLKNEFFKILNNIDLVVEQTNIDRPSIEFRIKNGLEAIRIAEKYIDKVGVAIW